MMENRKDNGEETANGKKRCGKGRKKRMKHKIEFLKMEKEECHCQSIVLVSRNEKLKWYCNSMILLPRNSNPSLIEISAATA